MSSKFMAGVSGVRGVVGESLTPEVILRYAGAFARTLGPGPVVFGRDSRPSGPVLRHAVLAALQGAGRDVIEIGIVPTPTVQIEVERQHAAGGLALTASHNPVEWNALKFVGPSGRFLGPADAARFLASVDEPLLSVRWDALGRLTEVTDAIQHHVDLILGLDEVDARAIAARRPRVVLDAVHGAGGAIARMLLERLGCDVTILFEEPTGLFPRPPEPLAENLGILAETVRKQGADFGHGLRPRRGPALARRRARHRDRRGVHVGAGRRPRALGAARPGGHEPLHQRAPGSGRARARAARRAHAGGGGQRRRGHSFRGSAHRRRG